MIRPQAYLPRGPQFDGSCIQDYGQGSGAMAPTFSFGSIFVYECVPLQEHVAYNSLLRDLTLIRNCIKRMKKS